VLRGRKSKEELNSSAFKAVISAFTPLQVSFECTPSCNTAIFSPYEYFDTWHVGYDSEQGFNPIRKEGLIRNFPMIFQGDGKPWDLGNLYLMFMYNKAAAASVRPSIETIDSFASHLLAYRRWIEDAQSKGQEIHDLYFPDESHRRVTYRYSRYLDRNIGRTISASTASTRISVITNFYRGVQSGGLANELENEPFKERQVSIKAFNRIGLEKLITVVTTDLRTRQKPLGFDQGTSIRDGGKLHPISEADQGLLLDYLERFDRYHFTLMVLFSIFTGARIATVCTLRIDDLRALLNKADKDPTGFVWLKIGFRTRIDLKFADKNKAQMRLRIPSMLVMQIIGYVDSPEAMLRRQQKTSFYGDTDDNYVFLTEAGTPYITSKAEIEDRQSSEYSARLNMRDRVDFVISKGNGIRNWVNQLNNLIATENPDYSSWRFHDLRATFGLNFVRDALREGQSRNKILDSLKGLMGHSSIETTLRYLDYEPNTEKIKAVIKAHADRLDSALKKVRATTSGVV